MGKGSNALPEEIPNKSNNEKGLKLFTWDEIKNQKRWIVIENKVYDVVNFKKKHPGGESILMNHISEDATDAFIAFHKNMDRVQKYMKTIEVGHLAPDEVNKSPQNMDEVTEDFRKLQQLAVKMGLYQTNYLFFFGHFLHIIVLDLLAWYLMSISGFNNWFTYMICVFLAVCVQAQAGWSQHDFGHLSVFKSTSLNHIMHRVYIGLLKGAGADWWNYRHFNHHAKPNVHKKDPDIAFGHWVLLGKIIPREIGHQKKGSYPYTQQQNYWMMVIPPLLLPIIFHGMNLKHLIVRKRSLYEAAWVFSFFFKLFYQYGPILGTGGTIGFYFLVRFFESFWFVFVTQMNHLPMHVDHDHELSWFKMQLLATCNVDQSFFNDWFTGHLNFQIEHHLFPTMPRHSYHKIAPLVKSLCEKHNIEYQSKPLLRAMADIYVSLKDSGEMWYEAYNM